MIVADVEQAADRGIWRNPGRLQQDFFDRLIDALGERLDGVVTDGVGRRADRRVDVAARLIEDAISDCGHTGWRRGPRRPGWGCRRGRRRWPGLGTMWRRSWFWLRFCLRDDYFRKFRLSGRCHE
jgi:hypothetical protein